MKLKQPLLILTGTLILGISFQAFTQDLASPDKARLLEEKKQQIERLAKENEELKQQVTDHESTIADFKSQIETLDQKIQKQKEQQDTTTGNNNT